MLRQIWNTYRGWAKLARDTQAAGAPESAPNSAPDAAPPGMPRSRPSPRGPKHRGPQLMGRSMFEAVEPAGRLTRAPGPARKGGRIGSRAALCGSSTAPETTPAGHWITSSAMASSVSGIVRPSALAVFMLITNSNLVGSRTGRSAGFSPFSTRPVYTPPWRNASVRLGA
jgi:hypothetical protein